jgi:hypothetical protein
MCLETHFSMNKNNIKSKLVFMFLLSNLIKTYNSMNARIISIIFFIINYCSNKIFKSIHISSMGILTQCYNNYFIQLYILKIK